MINHPFKSFLYVVLATAHIVAHAAIPFTWINGLHEVVKSEYSYLSPVNGLVWSSNDIVENMYRYGNDSDATIKLIKELFYLQPDEVSFVPTVREDKPATFWGVQHIAKILAVIEQIRDNSGGYDAVECKIVLKELLTRFQQDDAFESKAATRRELQKHLGGGDVQKLNAVISRLKDAQFKTITDQNVEDILSEETRRKYNILVEGSRSSTANIKEINKNAVLLIKTEVQRLEKERQSLQKSLKSDKDRTAKERKLAMLDTLFAETTQEALAGLISESVQESISGDQQKYMPYTTEQILLAFAWIKANPYETPKNPKQDFIDFFKLLEEYVDQEQLKKWLEASPYTVQDHERCKEQIKKMGDQAAEFLINNYGLAVFSAQASRAWDQPLPLIFTGRTAYYTDASGAKYPFPDCGETSLRNFFDIILRDRTRNIFAVDYLLDNSKTEGEFPLKPHANLVNFYKKYSSTTNLTAQSLYDAWTQVVSDLPGVVYLRPPTAKQFFEIKPGLGNILQVLNNLLFGNNPNFNKLAKKEQLDVICQQLSRPDFVLTWKAYQDADVNTVDFIDLLFTVQTKADKVSFTWKFQQNHFVISIQRPVEYPISLESVSVLATRFNTDQERMQLLIYNLMSNYITLKNVNTITETAKVYIVPRLLSTLIMIMPLRNQWEKNKLMPLLFSLFTNDQARNITSKIVEAYIAADMNLGADLILEAITDTNPDKKELKMFIEYIVGHTRPGITDKIVEYVFENSLEGMFEVQFINSCILNLEKPFVIASIAKEIIKRNLVPYAQAMHNTLERVVEKAVIQSIGTEIIQRNYEPLMDVVVNWIKDNPDDRVVGKLILEVINTNRSSLFAVAKKRIVTLPVELRRRFLGHIITNKIEEWYDFLANQIMQLNSDEEILTVANIVINQRIRPLFGIVKEKLTTITSSAYKTVIKELIRQLR